MNDSKERQTRTRRTATVLTLLIAANGLAAPAARAAAQQSSDKEKPLATTQSKFYCNLKALTPEERVHHKMLGDKLMAARQETIEMAKGYEFQFSPQKVTLAELADWVVAESKCCPFFDFHIDLEETGTLLCLRLTGEEGVKAFIRAEFSEASSKR